MKVGALLVSGSECRTRETQAIAELRLLGAAALGEAHLHVSSLVDAVHSIGAFELAAAPEGRPWRRTTGGRAFTCGDDALIVSLAVPHRSALVADERLALRPEQVMNRAARGLLGALRVLGLDPVYPGLDCVTVGGRAIAHLSFAETTSGPTLFQAILAVERPLVGISAGPATALLEVLGDRLPGAGTRAALAPREAAARIGAAYATAFGLECLELDPEVAATLIDGDGPAAARPIAVPPHPPTDARTATTAGRIGAVHAWTTSADGRIRDFGVHGAFIAPEHAPGRLRDALVGSPTTPADIGVRVREVVDRNETYLLGVDDRVLIELCLRASGAAGTAGASCGNG